MNAFQIDLRSQDKTMFDSRHQKLKILCADGDPAKLRQLFTSFHGPSVEVLLAKDGGEALKLLKLHGPSIGLAVLNTLLPVLDGMTLTQNMETRWSDIPVMLVGEPWDHEQALPANLVSFLPFDASAHDVRQAAVSRLGLSLEEVADPDEMSDLYTALIVDDISQVRNVINRFLTQIGLKVSEVESGREMNGELAETLPDLIILDVMLPDEDGLSILARLKKNPRTKDIPVIMVSGLSETEIIAEALDKGADDYLTKPVCSKRLQARVRNCLNGLKLKRLEKSYRASLEVNNAGLEEKVASQLEALKKSHLGTIFALSKLAESRDPETGEHLERLQAYCIALCEELLAQGKYSELLTPEFVQNLAAASPLHDIGKVGIADAVLLKPGKLSDEEFAIMKLHSEIGAATLEALAKECGPSPLIDMGIEIAWYHHEKWNGQGYPKGLAGAEIPLSARILALGDVYDALTSRRVYKEAFSHEKSKSIILEGRGEHFDPAVVDAFLAIEATFKHIRSTFSDPEAS